MFGKKNLSGKFQSYVNPNSVRQVLNTKPQESRIPLNAPSVIPYAL